MCPNNKDTTYISETKRQLIEYIDEHKSSDKNIIVFNHVYECHTCQNIRDLNNQFEIVKKYKRKEL